MATPASRPLGIKPSAPGKPLPDGQAAAADVVDNGRLLVDERSRAGLDVPHAGDRQWNGQRGKPDLSTGAQGRTWAFVYLTPRALRSLEFCHWSLLSF